MEFGERLKKLRFMRGWTQPELAAYAGVSNALISHLETGKHAPVLTTLHKLRQALDVSWNTLLGDL